MLSGEGKRTHDRDYQAPFRGPSGFKKLFTFLIRFELKTAHF